jgi:tripartite ATP-independent transporter DctP family solute receptor
MMVIISRKVFLCLIGLLLFTCKDNRNYKVLKLAHGLEVSHPVHQAMVYMASRVEEQSEGKLKIDIYPAGQLGQERECLELLQIGSLAMTKVSATIIENFAPGYKVLGLPYLFKDREHSYRVLDGEIGQRLLNEGQSFWLLGLTFYDAGSRSFYTKDKPIQSPDDLRGLKIRVMPSHTAMNMVSSLGGSPTPIAWGELYTALQQGVVDAAENNSPSFYFSHHYEVCKYYTLNEHTTVPDVLLISTLAWKKLTPDEQQILRDAARESASYQRKLWRESEAHCLEEVKKAGVTILYPDKKLFEEKVRSMHEQYTSDDYLMKLIEDIKNAE